MKKSKVLTSAMALTGVWGLASLGSSIAEAITPKGANFMRKLGTVVGMSLVGDYVFRKLYTKLSEWEEDENEEADEEVVEEA